MSRVAHHTLARQRLRVCHAIEAGTSYAGAAKRFEMPRTVVMFWHKRWKAERKAFHALFNRKAGPRRPRARFELWGPIRELWGKGIRGLRLKRALERRGYRACLGVIYGALHRMGLLPHRARRKRYWGVRMSYPLGFVQADCKILAQGGPIQYTAIECRTRLRFMRIYPDRSIKNSLDFVRRALEFFPMPIHTWQTDNGTEWTYVWAHVEGDHPVTQYLNGRGIVHRLIPAGRPNYNGVVERSHRTDEEDFYSWCDVGAAPEMLPAWVKVYNEMREHMALGWKTPLSVAQELLSQPVRLNYALV